MHIHLLKAQWELLGLRAPAFSWLVSAGLIAYGASVFLRHRQESKIRQRALAEADTRLAGLREEAGPEELRKGVPARLLGSIEEIFRDLPYPAALWQTIASCLVSRTGKTGEERFWLSGDIGRLFDEPPANGRDYRNASAIVTGVGLLATFLAILVALLDVRLAENRIQGLDLLIQGLSGKFLSSVVAVACATTLLILEKGLFDPVRVSLAGLGETLRDLLPTLAPAQIVLDSQKEVVEQLKTLHTRDRRLASELSRGLASAIEPALDRMVGAFHESLSGSASKQLAQMSDALAGTASMLQQMNGRLSVTGDTLKDLAELMGRNADQEAANRQAQIAHVTEAVGGLMVRLHDHAGESLGTVEKTLSAVVLEMSDKMTDLAARMAAAVETSSERSAGVSRKVLDQAGAVASKSAEQLAALLEKHSTEMERVEELKSALEGTLDRFTQALARQGETAEGLGKLAVEVNRNISSIAAITRSIATGQETASMLLSSSSGQIERLQGFAREQEETWLRIQAAMSAYDTMFQNVEAHARELLAQIARHLGGYSSVTEKHFTMLTTTADNFISQATGRLSGSIDELGEQLDELHHAVNKMACARQSMG